MVMGRCLTTDQIAALANGLLTDGESRRLMRHCDRCPACCSLLEQWRTNAEYANDIRRAVQGVPSAGSSELAVSRGLAAPTQLVSLMSRDSIRGYDILGEIHRGGQGMVYRAVQKSTSREVAIKVAFENLQAAGKRPHRLNREVELASRLKHPNIITIFDSGSTPDGRCYFVMDYVRGLPLDQYVRENELGIDEALSLFISICEAVNHAHQRGVIHRDLKPSNILVDSEGVAKVLDFGLAKALGGIDSRLGSVVSATGQILGTVPYMAPEQLAGRPDAADVRTDVYALGVLLYEVLAGCLPHDVGLPASQMLRCITEGSPVPPSRRWKPVQGIDRHAAGRTRRSGCPVDDELDAITLQAMSTDPDRRYQSAADLARDLRHYLAGEPVEAKRDRGLYVMRKMLCRYRVPFMIATAFILLLTAGLTVISVLYVDVNRLRFVSEEQRNLAQSERDRAIDARKEADNRAEQLRGVMYLNHLAAAVSAMGIDNLDRVQEEIYACPADLRGWEWYWLASQFDHSWRVLRGHSKELVALSFDAAGTTLVSGARDGTIRCWDLEEGRQIGQFPRMSEIAEMCVSSDSRLAAIWDVDRNLRIWETSGREMAKVQHRGTIRHMSFSPDSSLLAIGNGSGYIDICEGRSGRWLRRLGPHAACAFRVAFSPDGSLIASSSWDATVRIWNPQDGREIHVFQEQRECIPSLAWSPDGTKLISGGCNGSLMVWDALSGKLAKTLLSKSSYINSVACAPDNRLIAASHQDRTVSFWDLQTGEACGKIGVNGTVPHWLVFSPDGRWIACAGADLTIRSWEVSRTRCGVGIRAHSRAVHALAFGPGGRLASGGDDGVVRIWAVPSGELLHTLTGHEEKVRSVAFSKDGSFVVSGSMDKSVRIWDARTGVQRRILRGHEDCVLAVAIRPDGRLIASGGSDYLSKGKDNSVRIWDAESGEEIMCLRGHEAGVPAVAFSPDGTRVASGSRDKTAIVWDLETRRPISTFSRHASTIRSVLFTPDGGTVLTLSEDNTVQTWEAATGTLAAPPRLHPKMPLDLAMSPDGSRTAVCGEWDYVSIWKRDSAWELLRLPSQHGKIWSLAFSPDGTCLAAGGENGEIRIWRTISPDELRHSPPAAAGLAAGAMRLWSLRQLDDADLVFRETLDMHKAIFGLNDTRTLELARRYGQFERDDVSETLREYSTVVVAGVEAVATGSEGRDQRPAAEVGRSADAASPATVSTGPATTSRPAANKGRTEISGRPGPAKLPEH